MIRTSMLLIAAAATLAPSLAVARKPFFGRSYSRPATQSPSMNRPSAGYSPSQSLPTAILENPEEMTRRFGPSILEQAPNTQDSQLVVQPTAS